jgi:hypothetical protein
MKTILPILFILSGIQMFAQTDTESIGLGGGGGGYFRQATPEEEAQRRQDDRIRYSQGQPFRVVDKRIYNVQTSLLWSIISGNVYKNEDDVLILKVSFGLFPYIAVKNYSGEAVESRQVSTLAMPAGIYDMGGSPTELWDCGTVLTREQLKQIKDEEAKAKAILHKKIAEQGQKNVVRWLQSQATNGDAYAQCSLGEHYLIGQGCETNREQAILWLQKSAAQGYIEASNKLASLQKR